MFSRKNREKYIYVIFPEMEVSSAPLRCHTMTETVLRSKKNVFSESEFVACFVFFHL